MNKIELQKFKLPDRPGVYFFLKGKPASTRGSSSTRGGEILYIGKATSLKDRVKSYFSKDLIETRGSFIFDMVFKADKIKYEIADSVLEALILESNLIKKYQPKYNTREKDDRSFNYIVITKEKLPKVLTIRGKNLKKTENVVFGPYPNGGQLREALKIIRRIFPFLDDKSKNYLEFYRQINLAPDLNNKKMYLQNIRNIKLFFEGKKKKVMKNLEKEMKEYAKSHEFEKAGEIKRQIFAIKHINDVALLKQDYTFLNGLARVGDPEIRGPEKKNNLVKTSRIEAYDIAHMGGKNMVGVMTVVENGEMAKHEYKKFKIRSQGNANDTGALKEVLERRLAHTEWPYPELIVVDGGKAQLNTAKKVLAKLGLNIRFVSVLKNEHHKPKVILSSSGGIFLRSPDLRVPIPARPFEKLPQAMILLANAEAHRFAITYHKKMRNKNFLP